MNKILVTTFFVSIIFLTPFFLSGPVASAATPPNGIVSLSGCTGTDCSACNVVHMVNGGITWLIGILFVVFAVIMVVAGVGLVTSGGNQSALEAAKSKFTNAIIGLIIILSAWLMVDTIMRGLVGSDDNEGKLGSTFNDKGEATGWLFWFEVTCQKQVQTDEVELEPYSDISIVPAGIIGAHCSPPTDLVTIPGTSYQARASVAANFVRMQAAAADRGITLTVTSGYRSDERQTQLWDECPICQSQGTVARPCSRGGNGSKHTSGLALDLISSGNRSDIINACRSAGAGFTMTYERSGHVHCDWR